MKTSGFQTLDLLTMRRVLHRALCYNRCPTNTTIDLPPEFNLPKARHFFVLTDDFGEDTQPEKY